MSESQPSADTSMPSSLPRRFHVEPSGDSAWWMRYLCPRLQNHIRYRSASFTTQGLQIAYSSGDSESMTMRPVLDQWTASADSAYLRTWNMSFFSAPQRRFDPYHIRYRPPSCITH